MRLILIEDEPKTRSYLRSLIEVIAPDVEFIGEADSVETGAELIGKLRPQVILLDVELGDGSGFDLLAQLDEPPHVIFITAHDHYAIQAFRSDAVDYLKKPINPEDLKTALQRVEMRLERPSKPDFSQLLTTVQSVMHGQIAVPTRTGFTYLSAQEIIYIQSSGSYIEIHRNGAVKPLVVSRTLKDIQPSLEKHGFIRIHRSYLINASLVQNINKTDGGFVVMINQEKIPFSRQYKDSAIEEIRRITTFL